jgi:hypothetical protein
MSMTVVSGKVSPIALPTAYSSSRLLVKTGRLP